MAIESVTSAASAIGGLARQGAGAGAAGGGGLGQSFSDLLGRLAGTERATGDLVTRAATGENVDIADVMIATQAESLAFQVGLQVRNKLVEAYQEVFRMQV